MPVLIKGIERVTAISTVQRPGVLNTKSVSKASLTSERGMLLIHICSFRRMQFHWLIFIFSINFQVTIDFSAF